MFLTTINHGPYGLTAAGVACHPLTARAALTLGQSITFSSRRGPVMLDALDGCTLRLEWFMSADRRGAGQRSGLPTVWIGLRYMSDCDIA